MKLLRKISFPFIPVYHFITWCRNKFYDSGIFGSTSYDIPVICVGNLSVGGTGKSPMVEYLARLLKSDNDLAILSRGYKRKTKGFVLADASASALSIGDEPMQFHEKFDDVTVAVDADRRNGIAELLDRGIDLIVLDDAFQHRKVKAGFNILITTFSNPYFKDFVLPTGNLREPRKGADRADVILVNKCPFDLSNAEKEEFLRRIRPKKHQMVFFSRIKYDAIPAEIMESSSFTLVTGIANPEPLVNHLRHEGCTFEHLQFKDHHAFTPNELEALRQKDLILTTEKDHVRLKDHVDRKKLFYLPIKVEIEESDKLDKRIKEFIQEFKKQ